MVFTGTSCKSKIKRQSFPADPDEGCHIDFGIYLAVNRSVRPMLIRIAHRKRRGYAWLEIGVLTL